VDPGTQNECEVRCGQAAPRQSGRLFERKKEFLQTPGAAKLNALALLCLPTRSHRFKKHTIMRNK
jgi:hypothetical protein